MPIFYLAGFYLFLFADAFLFFFSVQFIDI